MGQAVLGMIVKEAMIIVSHLLAFFVELAALAAFARWGWARFDTALASTVASLVCVSVFVVLWGLFAAPKSGLRLNPSLLLPFKFVIFAGATMALAYAGNVTPAALFAVAASLHLILALSLGIL